MKVIRWRRYYKRYEGKRKDEILTGYVGHFILKGVWTTQVCITQLGASYKKLKMA